MIRAIRRLAYRVKQFRRAVRAHPSRAELAAIEHYLSPPEQRLFFQTSPRDQHHQLHTLRLLVCDGPVPSHLARAALLHDVGKGYVHLHERVVYVLLTRFAPGALGWLVQRKRGRLPRALGRIHRHAECGAATLRQLGATPRELELIARHHLPPGDDDELRALISADDRA